VSEGNHDFGKYGATGTKGGEAVAAQLDQLAGGITTPVTSKRGWTARLNYLTRTPHARQAARAAGLTVTDRTIKAWQQGRQQPSPASLQKIETAYKSVRRQNVARHLLKRLNANGGTRIEIHPFNQSGVDQRFTRIVEYRTINVRRWEAFIRAWAAGDIQGLDDAWYDVIVDLGSRWRQYEYVTKVGFAA
jgi:hypothetical protein